MIKNLKQIPQRISKSFKLLVKAFKNAKMEFWAFFKYLMGVSFVLSIVFYFVEHAVQPDEYCNWWQAFVWTLTRYIGDPGHFAGNDPVSITGRSIDTIIGIMKIFVYAVPAGLIAKSYFKAIEEDSKLRHLLECRDKIKQSFKRVRNPDTGYRVVPRNITIASLMVKKNLTANDIIETVGIYNEFKLRNLGDTQTRSEQQELLAVEMMPLSKKTVDGYLIGRTSYGIKINRRSNVTIVAPTADRESSIGSFAFYLSQFGGFNLVSRLFATDADERVSYFTIKEKESDWETPLKDFLHDIKTFSPTDECWNIFVLATSRALSAQVHFAHKNEAGDSITTINEKTLLQLFDNLSNTLQSKHNMTSDMDNIEFTPIGEMNISVKTGAGISNNAFILRMSYSFITWTDRWTSVIIDIANAIRDCMENPEHKQMLKEDSDMRKKIDQLWKKKGIGYGDD